MKEHCSGVRRLSIVRDSCIMREVNPEGSLRSHELEISRTMGMIQLVIPGIARREREEMLELIRRMYTGGVTPLPDSDRYSTNIEGARVAFDLGVYELQSTGNVIGPGCQAWDEETCERVFIVGSDFQGFKDWTKMIDPMHYIEHWAVLIASRDAQGWD